MRFITCFLCPAFLTWAMHGNPLENYLAEDACIYEDGLTDLFSKKDSVAKLAGLFCSCN